MARKTKWIADVLSMFLKPLKQPPDEPLEVYDQMPLGIGRIFLHSDFCTPGPRIVFEDLRWNPTPRMTDRDECSPGVRRKPEMVFKVAGYDEPLPILDEFQAIGNQYNMRCQMGLSGSLGFLQKRKIRLSAVCKRINHLEWSFFIAHFPPFPPEVAPNRWTGFGRIQVMVSDPRLVLIHRSVRTLMTLAERCRHIQPGGQQFSF